MEKAEDLTVTVKKSVGSMKPLLSHGGRVRRLLAPRVAGLFVLLLTSSCGGIESAPPGKASQIGATQGGAVGGKPVVRPATPSTPLPPGPATAKTDSSNATVASKGPAAAAPAEQVRRKDNAAPSPGRPAATPALDLASLEQRLRETKAIGLFTKIALKNQVDDLLSQFRAFHQGRSDGALAGLRERYNLLLLKTLSLLQDGDPPLAQAITASRETIWSLLADPAKFATL